MNRTPSTDSFLSFARSRKAVPGGVASSLSPRADLRIPQIG